MTLRRGDLPASTAIHFRRISRAAARGRGLARQAGELPFLRLCELPDTEAPLVAGGPCHPRRLAIIASWWLLREVEIANLTLACVSFTATSASVHLPTSSSDTSGQGTTRALGCACASSVAALCPYHSLHAQASWAMARADETTVVSQCHKVVSFPLFPDRGTTSASKKLTCDTVMAIAGALGLPLHTQTGAPRYSGHSFRATGAMYLAASGIDVWRIQLHGRWGSNAVLRYIRSNIPCPSPTTIK